MTRAILPHGRTPMRALLPSCLALAVSFAFVPVAVATTFIVTNGNDAGAGSLRAAITNANADPAGPHTIVLQLPPSSAVNVNTPLPPILQSMTIDGTPSPNVAVNGGSFRRGFFVAAGELTLMNLQLSNLSARGGNGGPGAGSGGGGGGLGAGGAVFVNAGASLVVSNVVFSNNGVVGGNGGATFPPGPTGSSGGGGGGMGGDGGGGSGGDGGGAGGGGLYDRGGGGGFASFNGQPGFGAGAGGGATTVFTFNGAGGGGGGGPAGGGGGAASSALSSGSPGLGGPGVQLVAAAGIGGLGVLGANGIDGNILQGGNGGLGMPPVGLNAYGGGGGGGPGGGGGGGSVGGAGGGGGDFAGGGGAGGEPAFQPNLGGTGNGGSGGFGGGGGGGRHFGTTDGASYPGGAAGFGAGAGGAGGGGPGAPGTAGGGGSAYGGSIFVRSGGSVRVMGGVMTGGMGFAGTGSTAGALGGKGIYFQDGDIIFEGGAPITMADPIGGAGGIVKRDAGLLVLAATANEYLGPTTVESGTLAFAADGSFGTAGPPILLGAGTLRPLSTLTVQNHPLFLNDPNATIDTNGFDLTFTGPVDGFGGLTKTGSGTLFLAGPKQWQGLTNVTAGVLDATGAQLSPNIPVMVSPGATFALHGPQPYTIASINSVGLLTVDGTLSLQGPAPSTIVNANGSGSLTVRPGVTLTVAGNAGFAGSTTIFGGNLVLGPGSFFGGSISPFPGGTLSGQGFTPLVSLQGGTVSPGLGGNGTLTIGHINFSPTGTLRIEVNGTSAGKVTLQSTTVIAGNLDIAVLAPAPAGTVFTIMDGASMGFNFNGLPDNALITVPGGTFRLNYFVMSTTLTALSPPDAPTNVAITPGVGSVTFLFGAPAANGGSPITQYSASCTSPATGLSYTVNGAGSPIVINAMQGGITYSCSVRADNAIGQGTPSAPVNVTPAIPPGALTVTRTGLGVVTSSVAGIDCGGDCYEPYVAGTMLSLTATPAAGSIFLGWSGACGGTGACNLTMDSPKTVGAAFSLNPLGDFDQDGIPNAVELAEGRDPFVKDNDVFANSHLFIMQQYRDFLGREADVAGLAFYEALLAAGTLPRSQLIENFFNSPEFGGTAAPIARLYFATFLRVPDYDGLLFQIDAFRTTGSLALIANNFTLSPEFQATYGALNNAQFVSLLYVNILGRTPVQAEIDFHVARLVGGATRGEVLVGFSESPEYQAAIYNEVYVTMMYVGMLRRAPEPSGFTYWLTYVDAGNSGQALILGFLNAPEYHNRFLP